MLGHEKAGKDQPHDEQGADLNVPEQLPVLVVTTHRRLVTIVTLAVGRHVLAILLALLRHHRRRFAIFDRAVRVGDLDCDELLAVAIVAIVRGDVLVRERILVGT